MKHASLVVMVFLVVSILSCKSKKIDVGFDINSPELLHHHQDELNQVIIYDVFTPPVASRIYSYTSLAFYESVRFKDPAYPSLTAQMHGFNKMPEPEKDKKYNYNLAASKAFFDVSHKVVFSINSLKNYETGILNAFKNQLDKDEYDRSIAFGEAVAATIIQRSSSDNYKQTRGMPKYQGSMEDGRWQPTSPDYMDGMEPYWGSLKMFILDSSKQCMPPPPPAYSTNKNSAFYKNAMAVYRDAQNLTDSQKFIVQYWDDNPFVVEHTGHMMFANKKITPGGHWMGITGIAARKSGADIVLTAQAYALTGVSLLEAFISCWEAKYHTDVIRPITFINKNVDDKWEPTLQTPPFPEYPSGHSAVSAAAATILTHLFGENFSFHDDSDKKYIGMESDFHSFFEASDQAAISRVWGGIHYPTGMTGGIVQGKMVGKLILNRLQLKMPVTAGN